ncbi:MAG: HlyD family efflux transporter periplasmic adaptor subunit [Planctomycetota bacterium]|nr:MAG: HlyD family efflux transporter periplasmic adaptor subunit [Planctomycetota bacterium]
MLPSKRRPIPGDSAAWCALLLLAISCAPHSHPSHSSASVNQERDDGPEPVAVTVFTEQVELFMEYPRLVPGLEARFLAHLTVLATGEPVRSGQLQLEVSLDSETELIFQAEQPTRDGLFIPIGTFDRPGRYEARIIVNSEQVRETIFLQPFVVHPDMESAHLAAEADVDEDLKDVVPFLLEQQWKIGLLLESVERRTLSRRLQVPGEIQAPQPATAIVSAPLAGRLLPPEEGELPFLGQRVQKGQVLAFLEPPLTVSDMAQRVANETDHSTLEMELLLREYDLQAKLLELEQTLHQAQARLEFSRLALARIESLRKHDLGTEAELEAARRDLEIARREGEGAQILLESFAQAKVRLQKIQARAATARGMNQAKAGLRYPLVAPIEGEIVEAGKVEGEFMESQGPIYRLVNLNRVWVAAHLSEFDLAGVEAEPGALLQFAAYPDRSFDVLRELEGRVVNFGRLVDPETRTVSLLYEISNPDDRFRVGMFVDVFLEIGRAVDAVAIPEEAIVMDNGRPVAFALLHGEAFQKRFLELGIRDGRFVEVLSGLEPGDRVATKGAYLVKLASASPTSFGEGHAH